MKLLNFSILFLSLGLGQAYSVQSYLPVVSAPETYLIETTEISVNSILQKHNKIREEKGLPDLKLDERLNASASKKARIMLEQNCWSHYCPTLPWNLFTESNYEYVIAGENLAYGFKNVDSLMNKWMESSTHSKNILNAQFTDTGIAIVNGDFQGFPNNQVIVVHFGKSLAN